MTATRKPIDAKATGLMVVLCALWGLQQITIKLAAADMSPLLQVGLRSGAGAAILLVLVYLRREDYALPLVWRPGLVAGLLFGVEFALVGEGLRYTSASHMAIFLYTAPIFSALGLHLKLPEERLTAIQWVGIALAFGGVVVSFVGKGGSGGLASGDLANGGLANGGMLLGDLCGIAAGACWGGATLAVRTTRLSEAPATVTLFYQLLGGGVLAVLPAVAMGLTSVTPSLTLALSLAFQIVPVTVVSYLVWFVLMRRYYASRLGVLSFMTPVFGIGFGVAILGDRLETGFLLGACLILGGIVMVSTRDLLRRRLPVQKTLQTERA